MNQAKITIPYAVANYAEIRERGFYYVDKTMFIPDLESYKAPVFLRPRRLGKSLMISMLAHYYDRRMASRFDFSKMVMADTIEGLEKNFNDLNCASVYSLATNSHAYADLFPGFVFKDTSDVTKMLEDVLHYVRENHLPPLYILIDEYDNFTNQLLTAYKDPLYESVTTADSFLRTFFKVIKAGIGEGSIRTCFCTGVLPVTMDDLTSGYNIAEILTLTPQFVNMLGFTHAETGKYLDYVIQKYGTPEESYDEIWKLIVSNYDGYRFLPDTEPLFNSTIVTYFFKNFAVNDGAIPEEMIDENLRTDINWIRRLTISLDNAKDYPSGRSDFEMTGIPGTAFYTDDRVVEFKYFKTTEAKKILALKAPHEDDAEQVRNYADTIRKQFPNFIVRTYVAYIVANRGYKFWEVH